MRFPLLSRRPEVSFGRPRLSRPQLELLEERCVPSTVLNLSDSGPGSLRQALLDTPAGGTIDFQPGLRGTIPLASTLTVSSDVTIAGPGQAVLTVNGNRAGSVFSIGLGTTVTISGLTIANGEVAAYVVAGGGIYNNGTLTLNAVAVQNNLVFSSTVVGSAYGGGVYNNGTLTVNDSTFSGNTASGLGTAGGGAIYNARTLMVTDSLFTGNRGGSDGGGAIENSGTATVTGCTFQNNTGTYGGALVNFSTATVVNSTFTGNSASNGGAILNGRTLTLSDCTLNGNSGGAGGGLTNGLGDLVGSVTLHNDLIAQNPSSSSPDVNGEVRSQGHNLIGNGTGGDGFAHSDLVGTAANPINPLLGPLQNNGGPTPTLALLPGSPAVNAGDNSGVPATDQRGFPRIAGGTADIGAFEVQPVDQVTHLSLQAPAAITAGTPFNISVAALNDFAQPVAGYTGTVLFAASNGATAVYPFTADDAGQHTFTGLVLRRAATYTVTGADAVNALVTGRTTFAVTPAAADHIALTLTTSVTAGVPFSLTVTVQDAYGNTVTGYTGTVHFELTGPVTAMANYAFTPGDAGSHTFGNLVLNQPETYTLSGADSSDPALSGVLPFAVLA